MEQIRKNNWDGAIVNKYAMKFVVASTAFFILVE